MIEDINVLDPSVARFKALLHATLRSLFFRNIYWVRLPFVLDRSLASNQLLLAAESYMSDVARILKKYNSLFQRTQARHPRGMMRWIASSKGNSAAIDDWYITGMVFEGR